MLSSSLSHLLERARARFGLEVEVFDSTLRHVYPESATALARMIEESPGVRQSLREALAHGHPEHLDDNGLAFQIFPLRRPARLSQAFALVAVRKMQRQAEAPVDEQAWPELARAIVEADFAAADALSDERQHSRRLVATLRFLQHLVETDAETDLAEAIVQAAAVWFDVDARIFQRHMSGEFVLQTALPGARLDEAARRLDARWLAGAGDIVRAGLIPEWGHFTNGADVVLVPLRVDGQPEWVLVLLGAFPAGAESEAIVTVLGRTVGVCLETIRSKRRDRLRAHFEAIVEQGGAVPELTAVRLVRELGEMIRAGHASLVLHSVGTERRLVGIGSSDQVASAPVEADSGWQFLATRFSGTMPLGPDTFATLDLRPAEGELFATDAEGITRVAIRVMQGWLDGAVRALQDVPSREAAAPIVDEFLGRIREELERADRFDLRLALVVIEIPPPDAAAPFDTSAVQDAVRQELRGSDVLWTMGRDRIGVLLTHTDHLGSNHVVGRLRARLWDATGRVKLEGLTVGHAALSEECRTAEALLSQAARNAQPVSM